LAPAVLIGPHENLPHSAEKEEPVISKRSSSARFVVDPLGVVW